MRLVAIPTLLKTDTAFVSDGEEDGLAKATKLHISFNLRGKNRESGTQLCPTRKFICLGRPKTLPFSRRGGGTCLQVAALDDFSLGFVDFNLTVALHRVYAKQEQIPAGFKVRWSCSSGPATCPALRLSTI